jgi:acyl-CoA dehydrogenase
MPRASALMDPLFDCFLDDSHRLFFATCRRFAAEQIAPMAQAWDEAEGFPREIYARAAEAGILGAGFPEELGGSGGDVFHALLRTEGLTWGGSGGVVAGLESLSIALPPILNLGTPEQRRRFVPPVLQGKKIAALAITEPQAGSEVAALRTCARRDGDHYVLDGTKAFITSGTRADLLTVLARTGEDPHGGLTLFVVECPSEGLRSSPPLQKMGWRASDTALLTFEGCRVPAANRLGEEGSGFAALGKNLERERLTLATFGHAAAELALHEAEQYARDRVAFGAPLLAQQVIRHKLARMATQIRAAKSLNYMVAQALRNGRDVMEEASAAKQFSADVAQEVCWEAVQIFGGAGLLRGATVERLYRDVRVLPIGGGTNEIMYEIIAKLRGYLRSSKTPSG